MEITFQDYFSIALGCAGGVLLLLTIVALIAWSCRKKGRNEAREDAVFPLREVDMPGYQGLVTSHSWQGGDPQPLTHVPPLQVGLDPSSHERYRQPENSRDTTLMPPRARQPQPPRNGRGRHHSNRKSRPAGDDKHRGRRPRSREKRTRPHEEPDLVLASRAKSLERPSSLFRPIDERSNRRLPDPPPTNPSGGASAGYDMRRAFSDRTLDDPTGYRGNDTPVSWQERFMAWKASQQKLGPLPSPDLRGSRGQLLPEYLAGLPADERGLNGIS